MPKALQYNWQAIKAEFLAGKSLSQISAERGGKPTPSAISKRAKKDRWKALQPGRKSEPMAFRDSPAARQQILDVLSQGGSMELAAQSVGIHPDTLLRWRKADPDLALACSQAKARLPVSALGVIDRAITEGDGDVGTSKWLLERHENTRANWRVAGDKSGSGLNITINIPRSDAEAEHLNARVIDGELVETD